MLANPLRTKRKSASAQRYLRSLGATIDMANLIMRPSKGSNQRRIVAWMFTKSQLGGRRGYWGWSPSGNYCGLDIVPFVDRSYHVTSDGADHALRSFAGQIGDTCPSY